MKKRGQNWVEVTRLFWGGEGGGHFLEYLFHTVISYKLKFCKESPRELNSVSWDWPIKVKAAANLFNLTSKKKKKRLNLSGKYSGGMFEGRTVPSNVHII